jgi:hypothetical protein
MNMIPMQEEPIEPLTRRLLPEVPWFKKIFGSLNNRYNESAVNAILEKRNPSSVKKAWRTVLPDADLVERILLAIGDEMGWKSPNFIPQDECFIVLKLWWHGIADNLERECCLCAIETIYKKAFPASIMPRLMEMNLGEFLEHFRDSPASL